MSEAQPANVAMQCSGLCAHNGWDRNTWAKYWLGIFCTIVLTLFTAVQFHSYLDHGEPQSIKNLTQQIIELRKDFSQLQRVMILRKEGTSKSVTVDRPALQQTRTRGKQTN